MSAMSRTARYALTDWQPHQIKSGKRKGQSVWKNALTGEIRDTPPSAREAQQETPGEPRQSKSGQPAPTKKKPETTAEFMQSIMGSVEQMTGMQKEQFYNELVGLLGDAEKEIGGKGQPIGFTTAKGSTYEVHPDGTTTRNKAARSDVGHEGDSGVKERTAKTIYVDADKVGALSTAGVSGIGSKGTRLVIHGNKATLLTWNDRSGKWGSSKMGSGVEIHDKPVVGLAPLELWKKSDDFSDAESYKNMHAGNAITALKEPPPKPGRGQKETISLIEAAHERAKKLKSDGLFDSLAAGAGMEQGEFKESAESLWKEAEAVIGGNVNKVESTESLPGDVRKLPTSELHVDPKRFQSQSAPKAPEPAREGESVRPGGEGSGTEPQISTGSGSGTPATDAGRGSERTTGVELPSSQEDSQARASLAQSNPKLKSFVESYDKASPLGKSAIDAEVYNIGDDADPRKIARRLTSGWLGLHDNKKATPEDRKLFEDALEANGVGRKGIADEDAPFDGAYMEGPKGGGVFTNDKVKIVRPGWVMQEPDGGEYVVAKAEVKRVS